MYDFTPILARLKQAKAASGFTNSELSARSGVSLGTLNKILSGDTLEPKLPAMMAVASALDISIDWLIYGANGHTPAASPLSPQLQALADALDRLNEEGQEKLLDYAADLVAGGRYKKVPLSLLENKNTAAARSGDRMNVASVSVEDEEAALPSPSHQSDI